MANDAGETHESFDIRFLRQLVRLMNENELTEVDLRNGVRRVRLRKRGNEIVPVVAAAPAAAVAAAPLTAATPVPAPPELKPAGPEPTANHAEIKSPMLGTFYRASAPDAPPFVELGSHVEGDTIVCIIEAMKVFNEIAAETRGKIVAILVDNGQPVEYGQPLFRVDPTG
jgi:acetyl-CoA carboxylase biotin carboxyl carrier protein